MDSVHLKIYFMKIIVMHYMTVMTVNHQYVYSQQLNIPTDGSQMSAILWKIIVTIIMVSCFYKAQKVLIQISIHFAKIILKYLNFRISSSWNVKLHCDYGPRCWIPGRKFGWIAIPVIYTIMKSNIKNTNLIILYFKQNKRTFLF